MSDITQQVDAALRDAKQHLNDNARPRYAFSDPRAALAEIDRRWVAAYNTRKLPNHSEFDIVMRSFDADFSDQVWIEQFGHANPFLP